MPAYGIELTHAAAKDIRKLPPAVQRQVRECIERLAENPRNQSVSKLTDRDAYRSRSGKFRILFQITDEVLLVLVLRVLDRKEAYKK